MTDQLAQGSSAAILKRHGDLVHKFIYSALQPAATATLPAEISTKVASAAPTKIEQLGDRCAYNFNSGGKEIDNHINTAATATGTSTNSDSQHHSYRSVGEDQCSRAGYRFSLIEVLSRLHDDHVLHNDRHALPVIQTEMQLSSGGGGNRTKYSPHHFRQCV